MPGERAWRMLVFRRLVFRRAEEGWAEQGGPRKGRDGMTGWIIGAIVALLLLYLVFTYNRLVRLRNRIEAAWAQIDVQLKRRSDLIPNLVETVKGYAAHERETFDRVTQARAAAGQARTVEERAQAENMVAQALRQLFAVAEAYPELRANESFLALQEELTGTESRIAFARQFYNEQVLAYDNSLETFPTNVIAQMFNFEPKPYFETEETTREAPKVDFGGTARERPQQQPPAAT